MAGTFLALPNETQLEFIRKEDVWRSDASVDEDAARLIEWLSRQPHLPSITDRKWLSHFITGCKYNLQTSKQVIESYFVKRAEYPQFIEPFTKEQLVEFSKICTVSAVPKLSPEGYRIWSTKLWPSDEENFDPMLLCRLYIAYLDLQLKLEPMYGDVFIHDLNYIKLSYFLVFTPLLVKRCLSLCLEAFPLRVKGVHFLNPPTFMGRILTLIKMFLPKKIKDKIYVHESIEDLYAFIPKDVLPEEYGGTGGTIDEFKEGTFQLFDANKEWLDARPKADLSKLPDAKRNTDGLDMNGTFRHLQID